MSVITVDILKGKVIRVGDVPVDVPTRALESLDGFKTQNIMPEPIIDQINENNLNVAPQQTNLVPEMNTTAQNSFNPDVVPPVVPNFRPEPNMTVAAMEETPVNTVSENIVGPNELEILELKKALANANLAILQSINTLDEAQQAILAVLHKDSYQEESSLSKAA